MKRLALSALVAAALVLVVAPTPARGAASVCSRFGKGSVAGHVKNARLTEISGLVASRRFPGVYWTHNDSGGKAEVFALTLDGTDLGAYAFPGATAIDWEDIGIGPKKGAPGSFIYAADIGDNAAELPLGLTGTPRDHVTIYRAPEPSIAPKAPGVALTDVEKFDLKYPGDPADAEAVLVDPIRGDLLIVTKSVIGISRVLLAPAAAMVNGATITMQDFGTIQILPTAAVSTFPGTFVTGVDISADGSLILLRTYQAILAFVRSPGQSVPDALRADSCTAPTVSEAQGESIAIAADVSRYVTISEGNAQPINVFSISGAPQVSTTTSTNAPTHVGGKTLVRTGDDERRALAVGALLLVAALGVRRLRSGSRSSAG